MIDDWDWRFGLTASRPAIDIEESGLRSSNCQIAIDEFSSVDWAQPGPVSAITNPSIANAVLAIHNPIANRHFQSPILNRQSVNLQSPISNLQWLALLLDAFDSLPDEPFGDVEHGRT